MFTIVNAFQIMIEIGQLLWGWSKSKVYTLGRLGPTSSSLTNCSILLGGHVLLLLLLLWIAGVLGVVKYPTMAISTNFLDIFVWMLWLGRRYPRMYTKQVLK